MIYTELFNRKAALDLIVSRVGKIVYTPPERCYTNVVLEETEHGWKIFLNGATKPNTFIPHSSVVEVTFKEK